MKRLPGRISEADEPGGARRGRVPDLQEEDVAGGHITVFSELVGASLSHPELAPEIIARAQPWIDFVEETSQTFSRDHLSSTCSPRRDIAFATHRVLHGREPTDAPRRGPGAGEIFELARSLAPLDLPAAPGPKA